MVKTSSSKIRFSDFWEAGRGSRSMVLEPARFSTLRLSSTFSIKIWRIHMHAFDIIP